PKTGYDPDLFKWRSDADHIVAGVAAVVVGVRTPFEQVRVVTGLRRPALDGEFVEHRQRCARRRAARPTHLRTVVLAAFAAVFAVLRGRLGVFVVLGVVFVGTGVPVLLRCRVLLGRPRGVIGRRIRVAGLGAS